MAANDSSAYSDGDLARLLAEMDDRLLLLQRELESAATPIARRGWDRRAQSAAGERLTLNDRRAPAALEDLEAPALPTRPVGGPPRAIPARRIPVTPSRSEHVSPSDEQPPAPRIPEGPRKRSRRRVADRTPAVAGERRGIAFAARPPAAPAEPDARLIVSETLVRETIVEAEQEARRLVEHARDRIAEIGVRTRALLEQSLIASPDVVGVPLASRPPAHRGASHSERRLYEGAVLVTAGPFDDIAQLKEFEDALSSVAGVTDVYIQALEHRNARFELFVAEQTALFAELQDRTAETLRVIEAGDANLALEVVAGEPEGMR